MKKALLALAIWSLSLVGLSPALAQQATFPNYSFLDAYKIPRQLHGFNCSNSVICAANVIQDQTGNPMGVSANPIFVSPGAGATFAVTGSITCSNCSGTGVSATFASPIGNFGTPGGFKDVSGNFQPQLGDVTNGEWVSIKASVTLPVSVAGTPNVNCVSGCNGSNASVALTSIAVPASATYLGASVGGVLTGLVATANGLMVDGSAVTQPVSGTVSLGGTLPAFAATPTFNCGTGCGAAPNASVGAVATLAPGSATYVGMLQGGNLVPLTGTGGNLNIQCSNCSGSGVSTADGALFAAGASLFAGAGGFYQTTVTANPLTAGDQGMVQLTEFRAVMMNLRNAAGAEVGVSAAPLQVSLANTGSNGSALLVTGAGGTFPAAQSGAWSIGLAAGTNAIGSITNTGFGITGTLPAFAATPTVNLGTIAGVATQTTLAAIQTALGTPFQAGGSIANTAFGILGTLPAFAATPTVNLGTLGGAGTAANQATIIAALGTPFQAGGSIGNSSFAVTQATAAALNATVVGTGTFGVQLTGATNNINNITGTISLPTGAATATLQTSGAAKTQIVDGSGNVIASTTNALNVACISGCTGGGGGGGAVFGPTAVGVANANPPVVFGGTVTGAAGQNVVGAAIKLGSTPPLATDTAIVVSISPNSVNPNGQVTMANSVSVAIASNQSAIPVTQSGTWSDRIVGNAGALLDFAGQNATGTFSSVLVGGQFNTTPATITSGNFSPFQMDAAGNLLVNVKVGGGGGAVTMVSGAVASGAYASGSIASGAYASGAFASGAFAAGSLANGANVVEGTITSAHTCSVAGNTIIGCLGQLDDDIKGPIPQVTGPLNAATAASTSALTVGGQYLSAQPTMTNTQQAALLFSSRGELLVAAGVSGLAVTLTSTTITGTVAATQSGTWTAGLTQGGSALSATNGIFSNLLQGNAVLSATNGLFANLMVGNAAVATGTGAQGATVPRVTVATDTATLAGSAPSVVVQTNNAQTAGTATATGQGQTGTGVGRQTLSQDSLSAPISISTATTTQIVALSGSTSIYVTSEDFMAAGVDTFQWIYGTGTACATGQGTLSGAYSLSTSNPGLTKGGGVGTILKVPSGNALCAITTAAVAVAGSISYMQF
jgi:hypothetical protein